MKHISSLNNDLIRHVEQLQRKSKARKNEGVFIIEGQREVVMASRGGFIMDHLLICGPILLDKEEFTPQEVYSFLQIDQHPEIISVTQQVYEKMAYRSGTEGCIAFAKAKSQQLADLQLSENPLILIAESTEKPGNVGALLRTADAAKVDAVIIANPTADLYNPNVIRSSVGCVFTVATAVGSTKEVIEFLKKNSIDLYAATLQCSERYDLKDYTSPCAIAVGTESTGLSEEIRGAARANIIIPMSGEIDSMNVSVSAAILIFEARRQRNFI
ncbi:RNA methyltransferase [Nonlabens sp.]|uniref:TrmH family RNA methyltransferase n=1 Tax=Nonlabens sp. TaxID=1888209 RepID=UPI001BD10238|nr:RNA methyltransferase [Nonlabens sp.]